MKRLQTFREHYQQFGSIAQAAWDIDMSTNQYQLLLSGKAKPSFPTIKKLFARHIAILNFPD